MNDTNRANRMGAELTELYGEELVSLVLYGSAARGDFREDVSDINLLAILRNLGIEQLRRATPLVAKWQRAGDPPPMMVSEAEWLESADVFPIEYSDIRDAHVLLAGRDPFPGLRLRKRDLRLQLEHELRSKKIQLRESLLAAGDAPDRLGLVLLDSLPTFLTLFRATLRLTGTPIPPAAREVVQAAARSLGFAPDPFLEVLAARDAPKRFKPSFSGPTVTGYLSGVESATRWLDQYDSQADSEAEV